ncbi:conjugal transfer protein [Embleya sp. MST-111070]|uniref:conjugal transfer protein n=1 Tax=Embleya sp. MST-111070 TaxID=3398231 RepID=UPI003F73FE75
MKLRRRDREKTKSSRQGDVLVETDEDATPYEASSAGWRTNTTTLSGVARLARLGAWALVASGPLLGIAALSGSSGQAHPAPRAAAAPPAASDTGPSGFALLYVAAYVEAGNGTEASLAPYYAGSVVLGHNASARTATRTVIVSSREVQPGYWSVTVAVRIGLRNKAGEVVDAGVQFYRVGVQAVGPAAAGGTAAPGDAQVGYAATSLPAQVAAPAAFKPSGLGYVTSRGSGASDPATGTARSFLQAYLAGRGELDRYTSPGVRLRPISPSPYTDVEVTSVDDDSTGVADQKVPADGALRRLLVRVDALDAFGARYPLTYALELRSRGGRWEVALLDDAPILRPDAKPAPAPVPTAPASAAPSLGASASSPPAPRESAAPPTSGTGGSPSAPQSS